jgi:hypothetical protein
MTEKPGTYRIGETVHTNAFLSVPGAEVIITTQQNQPVRIEELIAVLSRVAAVEPGRKTEYWVKLK